MTPAAPPSSDRVAPREWVGLAALLVGALWVRAWWIPALSRHGWEGHEAEYLQVFLGSWQGSWSTRVVPPLGLLYQGMGQLSQDPAALLWASLLASLLSIAALVSMLRRAAGAAPALLGGALVALYGNHAFWSSSAYNVMLPHALLLLSLALLARRGWPVVIASGLLMGAAAGSRVELVVYALVAATFLVRHGWAKGAGWGASALAVFVACLLPMSAPGAHPEGLLAALPSALAHNLGSPIFLAPFSSPAPMLLAAGLAVLALWRHPRAASPWALALLLGQLSAGAFTDAGFRHHLLPGVAICALQALGVYGLWGLASRHSPRTRWLSRGGAVLAGCAVLLLLGLDSHELAWRYYAPAEPLIEELRGAAPQPVAPGTIRGCTELNTSPARSPDELGPYDVNNWERCYTWREDYQHRRWTSLGVHDRGLRMHHDFALEPLGLVGDDDGPGPPPRQLWRVLGPR
jgi:hypothetical protein